MDLGLTGKVAFIGGASRGIGLAIARALGREGAKLFLTARGKEGLDAAVKELTASGFAVAALATDLGTLQGATSGVEAAIAAFGTLDLVINNAGGSLGSGPFDVTSAEKWTEVLNVNLMSAVWCSQRAVAHMKDHGGGAIVNVSSICGREYCTSAAYTAAKAALVGLSKEMAVDLAKHRIRVNSVAPGSIMFPGGSWDRRRKDKPELIEKMLKDELPWGRFGTPEEVADVVAFACSARAGWLTGACLPVDGGQGRAF